MPLVNRKARARYYVAAADGKGRLEDGWVALLLHEQRDVLEGVVVVHAEAAAQHMIAVAGQIIGEAYARAEALAVVARLLGHQGGRQGAEGGSLLEFLEGAALGNIRAADEIDVL